ncbi:hypothetical protein RN001_005906 [Aquatica leii]|uniref:Uncharacterized protein n=1 Tax=Aquatica leii TaxID=1421715 RepID=A0AAN7SI97_9COLE|nr:hypothetical protein RN001_005906 [Aquatica leii]
MKFLFVFALVIVSVLAERPARRVLVARYTNNQQQQQQQFVPLPISSRRARQQLPLQATTPEPEQTTTENAEEIEPQYNTKVEQSKPSKEDEKEKSEKLVEGDDEELDEGAYYIYHPSGLLQRVVFSTSNDPEKMALNAHLQLQNIDPISVLLYNCNDYNLYVKCNSKENANVV